MEIVVCLKQVLDPDALNTYALWGHLELDATRRGFATNITRVVNAYDEQAIEAALRLRDAGVECRITALTCGDEDAAAVLRPALAMGCDEAVHIHDPQSSTDGFRTAALLAAAIRERGRADLILCGRQGSDFDQGIVPAALAEALGTAYVTTAADIEALDDRIRVRRATPLGEEVVLSTLPATITVSNELGTPRYPTAQGRMRARRLQPEVRSAAELLPPAEPAVELVELALPTVQGHCEFLEGETPAALAAALLARLREVGALDG